MPQTVDQLLTAAMELNETEREELTELLTASFDDAPSQPLHPDWSAELRRRVARIESGEQRAVPWSEVKRQVQAQLDSGESFDG